MYSTAAARLLRHTEARHYILHHCAFAFEEAHLFFTNNTLLYFFYASSSHRGPFILLVFFILKRVEIHYSFMTYWFFAQHFLGWSFCGPVLGGMLSDICRLREVVIVEYAGLSSNKAGRVAHLCCMYLR
ncbi:hypothetical protein QBC44DRAFT_13741 [Cladorrhinum sp. PSN332]|nr:hypothetical protein QBC44DRAFT_13741 [Cladorrhinum sp. PSN332]